MRWWQRLLRARRLERELDAELRDHIERLVAENLSRGLSEDEARRHALIAFGGVEQVREECRDARGTMWVEFILRDVGFAGRSLKNSAGFTAVVVLTLAFGIGVNTSMFSLVNAALFRPIYAEHPDELVEVVAGDVRQEALSGQSYPNYLDFRAASGDVLAGLAAYLPYSADIVVASEAQRASVALVSDNYFSVLGIRALTGRTFAADENVTPGAHFVAVISESLWRRHFDGSPTLDGRQVWINGANYAVIGVVPDRAARLLNILKVDVFVPAVMQGAVRGSADWALRRGNREFLVIGRLKPHVPLTTAQARFAMIGKELHARYPDEWTRGNGPIPLTVVPATIMLFELRGIAKGAAGLLMAASACVLLIVCSNLATLVFARMTRRSGEIAVRRALGATRWRLVQQLLAEVLLLALGGALVSVLVAFWMSTLLNTFVPSLGVPLVVDLGVDQRVLAFGVVVTGLTALAFGLAPVLRATRPGASDRLETSGCAHTEGPSRSRLQRGLMVSQVAISLLLLMCAGMFLSSLRSLHRVDLGFRSQNLALVSASLGTNKLSPSEGRRWVERAKVRLGQLPGVEGVAVAARLPMTLNRTRIEVYVPGARREDTPVFAGFNEVDESYFTVMGIPLIRGRAFGVNDTEGAQPVGIVNEALAKRLWPGGDAIGRQLQTEDGSTLEVVGVTPTGRYNSISEDPLPFLYFPIWQRYRPTLTLHVRTATSQPIPLEALRRTLVAQDATAPIFDVETMDQHLAASLLPVRVGVTLFGLFGAFSLALACLGLYAVMSYSVILRTKELGVRMALGAQPRRIRRLVVGQGLAVAATGMAIGLLGGAAATAVIASQLHGVTGSDLATLAGVVLIQGGVALLACWLPARRATQVDPIVALRQD